MSKIHALTEGSYSVDEGKKFIPFDPAIHQAKDRPASLFVHVQPFLLEWGNNLVVFDTGLGYEHEQGELVIHQKIREKGYDPGDVTMVLMSHLHFDHAGGIAYHKENKWELSFPNADYFVQRNELESALTQNSRSYRKEPLEFLRRTSNLQLIDGDGYITEGLKYELTGGHCEFHQVFHVEAEDACYFFGGDVMPEAVQVQRKFIAKYDFDGRRSMELRALYGAKAVEGSWICLMYHDKRNAIVKFGMEEGAFVILPAL